MKLVLRGKIIGNIHKNKSNFVEQKFYAAYLRYGSQNQLSQRKD